MIFRKFRLKTRPQRTAEVMPTVVRCSPPLRGFHSLCYAHKLCQPLRSGSVGRPTHHVDFQPMEFSAGHPPTAQSLDIVHELRRGCGLRPPLRRQWRIISRSRYFFPNLCRLNHGSFMQAAVLHVEFFTQSNQGSFTDITVPIWYARKDYDFVRYRCLGKNCSHQFKPLRVYISRGIFEHLELRVYPKLLLFKKNPYLSIFC